MDAASLHGAERVQCDAESLSLARAHVIAQQKAQRDGPGEFWSSAKPSVRSIVSRSNPFVGLVENRGLQIPSGEGVLTYNLNELLRSASSGLRYGIRLFCPYVSHLL